MTKFWHIFGSVGLAAAGVLIPTVQHVIANNPAVVTALGAVWAIIGNLLQSPVPKSQ
jgi:hypothetical protein